jgi:hypothetical protein
VIAPAAGGHSSLTFLGREIATTSEPTSAGPPQERPPAHVDLTMLGTPGQFLLTGDKPLHLDDLFDRLLTRLRGELMDERERQGRLIGDGRW